MSFVVSDYDIFRNNLRVSKDPTSAGTRIVDGDYIEIPRKLPGKFRSGQDLVRRAFRGIQPKEETYATLAVVTRGGSFYSTRNSSSWDNTANMGGGPEYEESGTGFCDFNSNFMLQSVSEERSEKLQTMSTFGPAYFFFFGEQPRFITCSGILMNTRDFQWQLEWWKNYEDTLRGTRLVERMARVYMTYDDVVVEGYLVNSATSLDAQNPGTSSLRFTLAVTNLVYLKNPGAQQPDWEVGGDVSDLPETLDESSTQAVRLLNVQTLQASVDKVGLLDTLRTAMAAFADPVSFLIAQPGVTAAVDFLLGKNIGVPVGFLGSEASTAYTNLTSADLTMLGGLGSSLLIRVPDSVPKYIKTKKNFYENRDEYPVWEGTQVVDPSLLMPSTLSDAAITARAIAAFADEGIITEEQQFTGTGPTEEMRLLGRSLYGVLSYAASFGYSEASKARQEADRDAKAAALAGGA